MRSIVKQDSSTPLWREKKSIRRFVMEKLESSFKNMALSLVVICLVAGGALAGIDSLTKDPIAKAEKEKQQNAIMQVLPKVDGDIRIADAEQSNGITLYKAYVGDEWIGTAVEASTEGNKNLPFGGTFQLMVGFDTQGNVVNYVVLKHAETPGLGALMSKWFCNANKPKSNIIGKSPATTQFKVSKDGGDVDAITASTITSRAFLEVVEKAYQSIAQQPMLIEEVCDSVQAEAGEFQTEAGICPNANDSIACVGCSEIDCQKKGGKK
jgi:electron transport complex protein RnfG